MVKIKPLISLYLVMARLCCFPGFVLADGPRPPVQSEHASRFTVSADWLRKAPSKDVRRSVERARRYSAAGEHGKAIELLKQILPKGGPSEAHLRSMLGFEYLQAGQPAQARTFLAEAVGLLPDEPIGRSNLALALYALGEYNLAYQEITRALDLDPGNQTSKTVLQKILEKKPLAAAVPSR